MWKITPNSAIQVKKGNYSTRQDNVTSRVGPPLVKYDSNAVILNPNYLFTSLPMVKTVWTRQLINGARGLTNFYFKLFGSIASLNFCYF